VKIAAAAIKVGDMTVSLPPPARHHDVLRALREAGVDADHPDQQGFLTSEGKFASRFQARAIAKKAGQILKSTSLPDLYSEDLW
jgi:acetyl/propionyl-CoA carboxylase alpha subunit